MTATGRPIAAVQPTDAPRTAARGAVVVPSARRFVLVLFAGASLMAGLFGALVLLGVTGPTPAARLAGSHGLLMTFGFLGTLIALERAVALARPWGFAAPLACGLAGVGLIAGAPAAVVTALLSVASIVYLGMYLVFLGMDRGLHTWVQAAGAVGWVLAAALLLAGRPVSDAVPALAALLILTVAGERLELARMALLTPTRRRLFVAAAGIFGAGVLLATWSPDAGLRLGGVGLLALAAWLARFDIARRTVRIPGVTRFIALCLLAGYAWLAVGGATWLVYGAAALARDAMLHALFLGFVISMVYGHAPVILPAVLRVPLPYRPWFYGHLVLLHAGLVVRVVVGDLFGIPVAWQVGGVLTVVSMLVFVAASVTAAIGGIRARRPSRLSPAARTSP
jgi:hypothetical protein